MSKKDGKGSEKPRKRDASHMESSSDMKHILDLSLSNEQLISIISSSDETYQRLDSIMKQVKLVHETQHMKEETPKDAMGNDTELGILAQTLNYLTRDHSISGPIKYYSCNFTLGSGDYMVTFECSDDDNHTDGMYEVSWDNDRKTGQSEGISIHHADLSTWNQLHHQLGLTQDTTLQQLCDYINDILDNEYVTMNLTLPRIIPQSNVDKPKFNNKLDKR